MDMVSPSFSLYAFSEVLTELPHLSNPRLVVPPTSTAPTKGTEQEQLGLLGTAADRASRNKLQAPWLAKKLAAWLEAKPMFVVPAAPFPRARWFYGMHKAPHNRLRSARFPAAAKAWASHSADHHEASPILY